MKISIVFMLIYVIASSWCQDETVFHCSPKPGCQIAQCDLVAVGWDRPGFNIDEHLHDKEFPITCKSMNDTESKNTGNLLPVVTRNILDIRNIRSELEESKAHFARANSEIREHRGKIAEQSNEIKDIRNNALHQSRQIEILLRENTEQNSVINELKKELIKFQERNDKLEKELNEQNKTNNLMEKAMERIEQKLSAMKKPQQVQSGNQQRLTTTIQTTLKPTPSSENCELKVGKICYIFVLQKVDYDTAVDICKRRNADVGLIRNEEPYNAIVKYLAINDLPWINIWTGIRFDPMTRDVTPADSFIKWGSGFPHIGINRKHFTNVYIYANFDLRYQAMENGAPTWKVDGVICEILI
uniref:uncharacterized protein LOC120346318 isoform X1 n=1 Tax=Styela clava TaxID=7725 RepID=UPI001939B2D2|nr:uncharacterized protein LOC120346318 isoform X1 [Styela clava]